MYYGLLMCLSWAQVPSLTPTKRMWWQSCFRTWQHLCPNLFTRALAQFGAMVVDATNHRLAPGLTPSALTVFMHTVALELVPVDVFHNACESLEFVCATFGHTVFPHESTLTLVTGLAVDNACAIPGPLEERGRMVLVVGNGTGNENGFLPFCGMDVIGHEIGHLVVACTTRAGLVYTGESGAINESFADIVGYGSERYMCEQYIHTGRVFGVCEWDLGEDLLVTGKAQRSMSQPARYGQPSRIPLNGSTLGLWYMGDNADRFVHINSGVGNYCFFRVCQERSVHAALLLWYAALRELPPTATYRDLARCLQVRDPTIQSLLSELRLDCRPPERKTPRVHTTFTIYI
jgi:hypothetical protein